MSDDVISRFPLNAKAWQEGYDAGRSSYQTTRTASALTRRKHGSSA
jgi:hypothetical protein